MLREPNRSHSERLLLSALAVAAAVVGIWASAAPASFYQDFVLGRQWVALDGPYNEHLVRDVGGLNLALAILTVTAARWPHPRLVGSVAVATLAYAIPHVGYHTTAMEPFGVVDIIAQMVTLSGQVGAPLALLWSLRPQDQRDGQARELARCRYVLLIGQGPWLTHN